MVTKEQALTCDMFHDNKYHNADGTCQRWRRNGATKTWKRTPNRFRVPVKHGMYHYGYVTNSNAHLIHTEEDCPQTK